MSKNNSKFSSYLIITIYRRADAVLTSETVGVVSLCSSGSALHRSGIHSFSMCCQEMYPIVNNPASSWRQLRCSQELVSARLNSLLNVMQTVVEL